MAVLVVQSHPSMNSFNEAILERVMSTLKKTGSNPSLVRLGKEKQLRNIVDQRPDTLIFVYPTWWGGYPASLLEWINEVLLPQKSLFQDVQEILSITTHGSSKLVNFLQGEWGRAYTKRNIGAVCHPDVKIKWVSLYKIDRCTHTEIEDFLGKVSSELT